MQASVQQPEESEVDREYKAQAASNRFGQQISYGVGAAMVFGLFSALAQGIIGALPVAAEMGFNMATILPFAGLAGLAVLGVSALYMSAKFISRATLLDNEMQARKIQQAKQQSLSNEVTLPKVEKPTQQFPQSLPDEADAISDATPEKKWTDRFAKSGALADMAAPKAANDESWGDKIKATEPMADKKLAAL